MSTTHIEREYKCWNDCKMSGCPGHTATLDFQSTMDALTFNDGKGREFHGQTPEFGAMLSMLHQLAGYRAEVSSMLDEALSSEEGSEA